jgi:hypothetical protein
MVPVLLSVQGAISGRSGPEAIISSRLDYMRRCRCWARLVLPDQLDPAVLRFARFGGIVGHRVSIAILAALTPGQVQSSRTASLRVDQSSPII